MFFNVNVLNRMDRFQNELSGLFSHLARSSDCSSYPLTNVYEDKESILVTAELPGMTKENVTITYADNVLTIAGKKEPGETVKAMTPVQQERAYGAFEKKLRVQTKIDQDKINASFSNGILTVTLQKAEEAKPKIITIEAN